ncbi:nitroreductase family deazaflavin-dependent oxidoreductase [Pseudolysinimonas sp.]|uniref:nitroreductase family deazaflavin-dependent oxidoreductase n=1 Tax=Pseudolysinimonas sp. TaxID=2680009 RepID=UPI003F8152BC
MASLEQALAQDRVVDITTTGRTSGEPRRIEIWFERFDDRYWITGTPGSRGWYANLLATPDFTFHLKESAQADLLAHARPVTGEEKARVLAGIMTELPAFAGKLTDASPLVEVTFDGIPGSGDRD